MKFYLKEEDFNPVSNLDLNISKLEDLSKVFCDESIKCQTNAINNITASLEDLAREILTIGLDKFNLHPEQDYIIELNHNIPNTVDDPELAIKSNVIAKINNDVWNNLLDSHDDLAYDIQNTLAPIVGKALNNTAFYCDFRYYVTEDKNEVEVDLLIIIKLLDPLTANLEQTEVITNLK